MLNYWGAGKTFPKSTGYVLVFSVQKFESDDSISGELLQLDLAA